METDHTYLVTLEVDRLDVGQTYDPLPTHLTLVSRFHSTLTYNALAGTIGKVLNNRTTPTLTIESEEILGPKQTDVYIVGLTPDLQLLHDSLVATLTKTGVQFNHPEFISRNWKPHISKRSDRTFRPADTLNTPAAYLIEVEKNSGHDLRHVRHRFALSETYEA